MRQSRLRPGESSKAARIGTFDAFGVVLTDDMACSGSPEKVAAAKAAVTLQHCPA